MTSYDGRNRSGRLFNFDEEQAYTFDLVAGTPRASLIAIADAARAYALRQQGQFDSETEVVCAFTSIDAPDGRKKRLKIFAAGKDFEDIDVNEVLRLQRAAGQFSVAPSRRLVEKLQDDSEDDLLE
ncbi:hypothetical protein [Jannaschia pohangensis]|uniref:hypothetical protein n=1 Tax=Jannaschia pohangensis TaxID=390807 RepID=UPI0011137898|nr:hypothetical protein [Jannaschia pohangensis]